MAFFVMLMSTSVMSAEHCMEYNNFNSLFAIVSGLGHGCVSRLRQTWDRLPTKWIKLFEVSLLVVDSIVFATRMYCVCLDEICGRPF